MKSGIWMTWQSARLSCFYQLKNFKQSNEKRIQTWARDLSLWTSDFNNTKHLIKCNSFSYSVSRGAGDAFVQYWSSVPFCIHWGAFGGEEHLHEICLCWSCLLTRWCQTRVCLCSLGAQWCPGALTSWLHLWCSCCSTIGFSRTRLESKRPLSWLLTTAIVTASAIRG